MGAAWWCKGSEIGSQKASEMGLQKGEGSRHHPRYVLPRTTTGTEKGDAEQGSVIWACKRGVC